MPMHMHMHMHSRGSSSLVFAEALCSQHYQRVIRLATIYRMALPGGWRVREAIRAGGLVREIADTSKC